MMTTTGDPKASLTLPVTNGIHNWMNVGILKEDAILSKRRMLLFCDFILIPEDQWSCNAHLRPIPELIYFPSLLLVGYLTFLQKNQRGF